jgi:hypothetical protein
MLAAEAREARGVTARDSAARAAGRPRVARLVHTASVAIYDLGGLSMLPINLALVSEVPNHPPSDVSRVAAALQKQVTRDFAPIWDVVATVDAFPSLDDVPIGYWPMIVRDDIGVGGAAGIHLDKDGQPFALITYNHSWSLTASHETLEMLADPFGDRLIAGQSVKPDQGRVEYLVEVCDPSEAAQFGYTVNGILVSDFYTPRFFDPVTAAGVRYSFKGVIPDPRTVLEGGYVSWHDPISDHWWQQTWFDGDEPEFRDLGIFDARMESVRAIIDRLTPHPELVQGLSPDDERLRTAVAAGERAGESMSSKAASLHEQISALIRESEG